VSEFFKRGTEGEKMNDKTIRFLTNVDDVITDAGTGTALGQYTKGDIATMDAANAKQFCDAGIAIDITPLTKAFVCFLPSCDEMITSITGISTSILLLPEKTPRYHLPELPIFPASLDPDEERAREEHRQTAITGKTKVYNAENSQFPHTELGNSRRLIARYGDIIRYSNTQKSWFIWNKKYWEWLEGDGAVITLAKRTVDYIRREAISYGDTNEARNHLLHYIKSSDLRHMKSMVGLAESTLTISAESLNTYPRKINFQNGTWDIETGEFYQHRQKDLITKCTTVSYNPTASCPKWIEHIKLVFNNDAELIESFQMSAGYSLIGDNPEQVLFLNWGGGLNGKSVTMKTIALIVGNYKIGMAPSTLYAKKFESGADHRNDIVRTRYARLILTNESNAGRKLDEGMVKIFTGGDGLVVRGLYQKEIEFYPDGKVWLSTQHKPKIMGQDLGIWRRIFLYAWCVTIPTEKRIRDYEKILYATEGEGILKWLLEGLIKYLNCGALLNTKGMQSEIVKYKAESDVLIDFTDRYEFTKAKTDRIKRSDLFSEYKMWCKGIDEKPIDKSDFNALIEERADLRQIKGIWWWFGIKKKINIEENTEFVAIDKRSGNKSDPRLECIKKCGREMFDECQAMGKRYPSCGAVGGYT
jgi:P4 family phage/plasmid primase-like protien